ncbi:MAG: alpha/beta hydrolase [Pseudomonadota bacterium]
MIAPVPIRHCIGATTVHELAGTRGPILMLPPLARGMDDLLALGRLLNAAGWRVLLSDPPEPVPPAADLAAFAAEAAGVLDSLSGGAPAIVLGATFGGRVARKLATDRPALVRCLILLAAGGLVPPRAEDTSAARRFMTAVAAGGPLEPHLPDGRVYLGREADPLCDPWRSCLLQGWVPSVIAAQRGAARAALSDKHWIAAGGKAMLAIEGGDDVLAPPGNAACLAALPGARVMGVTLPGLGHWMALEAPDRVADAILSNLDRMAS